MWIELGLPEEDRLRKACNRAGKVILYTYGDRAFPSGGTNIMASWSFRQPHHLHLPGDSTEALAKLANRSMSFQVTIQDGEVTSNDSNLVTITPEQRLIKADAGTCPQGWTATRFA